MDINYLNSLEKYYLKPGYIYVSKTPSIITTVLGSCISVCLYDINEKYGGMNHYLFPRKRENDQSTAKYGDIAIYSLIKSFLDFGSNKSNLYATIVGGAHLENSTDSEFIAGENIKICRQILNKVNIKIVKEVTGGIFGRKVDFYTALNEVEITKVKRVDPEIFIGGKIE